MIKYLGIILIITNIFLYANETVDEIIDNIVLSYNPRAETNEGLTEKELNMLCGKNHTSGSCESIIIFTQNKIKKKKILYLLNKISKKYNLEQNTIVKLNDTFIKYVEKKQDIDIRVTSCYYTSCTEKNIQGSLMFYESFLESILNNKIVEPINHSFQIKELDNLYIDTIEHINFISNFNIEHDKFNFDSMTLKSIFLEINDYWKNYEVQLIKFLKDIDKYNIKWIKYIYSNRFIELKRWEEYFSGWAGADPYGQLLNKIVFSKFEKYSKDNKFFYNIPNDEIIHSFNEMYYLNKNKILMIYETKYKDFDCHACVPHESYFIFEKENNKWLLRDMVLNKKEAIGAWGELLVPRVIRLKNNSFILKYDFTYSSFGYTEEKTILKLYSNNKLNTVLFLDTGFDDSGAFNISKSIWESKISFINYKKNIPDLIIEKLGVENFKDVNEKTHYYFDNNSYILEK